MYDVVQIWLLVLYRHLLHRSNSIELTIVDLQLEILPRSTEQTMPEMRAR